MGEPCRLCGCTEDDCSKCVERTGEPCHRVAPALCSACVVYVVVLDLHLPHAQAASQGPTRALGRKDDARRLGAHLVESFDASADRRSWVRQAWELTGRRMPVAAWTTGYFTHRVMPIPSLPSWKGP